MEFNKQRLQAIINDKSSKWGITEKTLTKALAEIADFDRANNKAKAESIYTKGVLRSYLRNVHKEDRQLFVRTGDKKYLKNVYEVFPVGKDGMSDISELMTWAQAFKDKRVMWRMYSARQFSGSERSYSAAETMTAFADLASGMAK